MQDHGEQYPRAGSLARPLDGPKESPTWAILPSRTMASRRSVSAGELAHSETGNVGRPGFGSAAQASNDVAAPSARSRGRTGPTTRATPRAAELASGNDARGVTFFVRGQPIPQGSLRSFRGRIVAANEAELKRWRGFVWTSARNAWGDRPPIVDRAVEVEVTFYVISDRRRSPLWLEPETGLYRLATSGANDVDKLTRAVFDGITESKLWKDDGLVTEVRARAYFASPPDTPPGALVKLREL